MDHAESEDGNGGLGGRPPRHRRLRGPRGAVSAVGRAAARLLRALPGLRLRERLSRAGLWPLRRPWEGVYPRASGASDPCGWGAGLFDGEGSLHLKPEGSSYLVVEMHSEKAIRKLHRYYGGTATNRKTRPSRYWLL